eukprot:Clim_evm67s201 gene=Clim_evmTU67s201
MDNYGYAQNPPPNFGGSSQGSYGHGSPNPGQFQSPQSGFGGPAQGQQGGFGGGSQGQQGGFGGGSQGMQSPMGMQSPQGGNFDFYQGGYGQQQQGGPAGPAGGAGGFGGNSYGQQNFGAPPQGGDGFGAQGGMGTMGQMADSNMAGPGHHSFDEDDEPPLLEELGINFEHILDKTKLALNPMKPVQQNIMDDTDLAGPLVFCLAFGASLMLSGKISFGHIYGFGLISCVGMWGLLNMMVTNGNLSFGATVSTLGYCLLPLVFLSTLNVVVDLRHSIGLVLAFITILFCTITASRIFVATLNMSHQMGLVAYPCALVYGVFTLLAMF